MSEHGAGDSDMPSGRSDALDKAKSKGAGPKVKGEDDHAPTGLPCAQGGSLSPDLQAVVEAWPSLPDAIRAGIVAMVRAAKV
ncbi:MAG: hypothetical protein AB1696_16560 [Planctomycetota bacterium]